jgi:predicted transcriptional regulator of viral defense system
MHLPFWISKGAAQGLSRPSHPAASGAAWKRLGYLAELLWPKETRLLDAARRHVTTGNARLDPTVRRPGKLVTRWRLFVNVDVDELRAGIGRKIRA